MNYARAAARTLFACILILITINAAMALTITDIQAPSTIAEGSLLQLSFTTDTPANYRILEDGVEVSASDNYDEQLDFDSAGLRTYTFEASDVNTTINETRIIEILDASLSITVSEPASSDYATTTIPVALETNIAADLCYTVTETATHTLTQESPTSYSGSLTFADGLRSIVRQDPDKIMVGEIRDKETAFIAINAALIDRQISCYFVKLIPAQVQANL